MDYARNRLCVLAGIAFTVVSSAVAQNESPQTTPAQPPPSLLQMQDFQRFTPLRDAVPQPAQTPGSNAPVSAPAEETPPNANLGQLKTPVPPPVEPAPAVNPPVLPTAGEQPLNEHLTQLKGIVVLGSFQDFKSEGVGGVQGIDIEGPSFLKGHKAMVSVWVGDFLGKPLGPTALDHLQGYLIRACRQLDRPVVDVYYPEQEIVDGVVQVIIYEGKVSHFDVVRPGRSPTFSADEVKDMPGFVNKLNRHSDSVSALLWAYEVPTPDGNTLKIFQSAVTSSNRTQSVVQALNEVIGRDSIYDTNHFKGVSLRHETVNLLKARPTGSELAHLNRLLLEDAYPRELSRSHLGRKWFSDAYLTNHIHLRPGGSISQERLVHDVEELNRDTQFLEVSAFYKQANFSETNTGSTDIGLTVKERFPLRVFAGYDNYGLKVLGENQLFGGFNYGNVFGAGDQLNYQYTTDVEMNSLEAHTASFLDPLPWGHTLTIFGGYNSVRANLAKIGYPTLQNSGYTYQIGLRYTVPLTHWAGLDHSISAGFDFKSADTAIQFGQVNFTPFAADIDQFTLGYNARLSLPDRIGYFQFNPNGYYSPGGLLGRNTDADFSSFHRGLKSDYYYGRVEGELGFYLPWGLVLMGKGGYQNSSTGLMPSEEFYLGGHALLRGYPEDIESGDQGYYATVELHSPLIHTSNLTGQKNLPGQPLDGDVLDIFGFYDFGVVDGVAPNSQDYISLDSAGAGLTYHVSQNLKADFSYGFELQHLPSSTPPALSKDRSRAHVSATLAF
jgi:hemolysin activation/secretion protein